SSVPDDIFFLHSLKVSHAGGAFSQNLSGSQVHTQKFFL
ncbi:hypothetical protein ACVWZX_004297, partial [Deinococcus sp. UYEF24]